MTDTGQEQATTTHEISAYYSSDGQRFLPVLECSCGYVVRHKSWEQVGIWMDSHLQWVRP